MGISTSLLGKLGVPGVESLARDQVYENFFAKPGITKFEDFHIAFIELCNEINTILPGKHFKAPKRDDVKVFFDEVWSKKVNNELKKNQLIDFIKKNVGEHKPNERTMIITGLLAPAAGTLIKRTGQNSPQLKKFRLDLIPNFVFAPAVTLVALVGVRGFQIRSTTRS